MTSYMTIATSVISGPKFGDIPQDVALSPTFPPPSIHPDVNCHWALPKILNDLIVLSA